jgi:ketosteroid isomerase-like protein
MATPEQNEQLVRNFFATLSTGDLEKIRATLHAGIHTPRDVIVDQFLAPVRGIFEDGDPKTVVDNIFCKGNMVCAETRGMGKLRNGKTYNNQYCWVIEVKDGLVHIIREYMDSHYVMGVVS